MRGINDGFHSFANSIAYVIMVINFLQSVEPPVLPCNLKYGLGKVEFPFYDCSSLLFGDLFTSSIVYVST